MEEPLHSERCTAASSVDNRRRQHAHCEGASRCLHERDGLLIAGGAAGGDADGEEVRGVDAAAVDGDAVVWRGFQGRVELHSHGYSCHRPRRAGANADSWS